VSEGKTRRDRAASILALLGAIAVSASCDRATPVVPGVRDWAEVRLVDQFVHGTQYTMIDVVNRATEFICIHKSFFEPEEGTVTFYDEKGVEFRTQMPGDRFPEDRLGFDYRDSYYIVEPGKHVKVDYDLRDFHLVPGRYRYHILMPFYMCRDIIDLRRIRRSVDAKHLAVETNGEFEFARDPARP
jgi:hypothetical protein